MFGTPFLVLDALTAARMKLPKRRFGRRSDRSVGFDRDTKIADLKLSAPTGTSGGRALVRSGSGDTCGHRVGP